MSKYRDKIEQMRWSHSRLTSFEHCPYSFYLNYIVDDDEQYLAEGNYYAEVGSFLHEILAMIFNGQLKPEDAVKYYENSFDDNVLCSVNPSTAEATYEACRDYLENETFNWANNYEILGVELRMDFEIDGYAFIGFIDLLLRDKRDNKIVIMDHKSSAYPLKIDGTVKKNSANNFESYKRQMYLYAYAVKKNFGEFPKELIWNHFKEGGKLAAIPFCKDEYEKTLEWATDVIHRIENEENYEPEQSYFYCKNLCSFRNCCEYIEDKN